MKFLMALLLIGSLSNSFAEDKPIVGENSTDSCTDVNDSKQAKGNTVVNTEKPVSTGTSEDK